MTINDTLLIWAQEKGIKAPVLIYGGSEEQLSELAIGTAASMWCEEGSKGCGRCRQCRQIKAVIHPDLYQAAGDTRTISIKSIREIVGQGGSKGLSGRKAIIIRSAEKMTIPAANALLKTLEESRAGAGFILTTRWPSRLLATIRSRCIMVNAGLTRKQEGEKRENSDWSKTEIIRKLGGGRDLTGGEWEEIGMNLTRLLKEKGPTPAVRRTAGRLRDYYRIVAAGGNERMAKDVLLGELAEL